MSADERLDAEIGDADDIDVDSNEIDTAQLLAAGEPSVLGAAATVEDSRERHKRQKVQRRSGRALLEDGTIEFVYEPHVAYMPPLRSYLRDLWERRAFLVELARSSIRGKRANTVLGSLWALLDPLFMASIYLFLFSVIRQSSSRTSNFVPLIVAGVMHYQVTTGAMTEGGDSIANGKNLMLNSTFPRALLPLSVVYKKILEFLPAIPIILAAVIAFNGLDTLNANFLWFFPVFFVQLVGAIGLALLISTIVVFLRDASNLMSYIARILFFCSPIIIPFDIMPERLVEVLKWQPIFGIFAAYQNLYDGTAPNLEYLLISVVWAVVLFVFGAWLFLRNERRFASKI